MAKMLNLPNKEIKRLYEEGFDLRKLATKFGCSRQAISTRLKKMNVKMRAHAEQGKPTIKIPSAIKLAYITGLLNGEGTIARRNPYHYVFVKITNTDLKMLKFIQRNIGGTIYKVKSYSDGRKQLYVWEIYRKADARLLLHACLPFLITKKDIAIKALKILSE